MHRTLAGTAAGACAKLGCSSMQQLHHPFSVQGAACCHVTGSCSTCSCVMIKQFDCCSAGRMLLNGSCQGYLCLVGSRDK